MTRRVRGSRFVSAVLLSLTLGAATFAGGCRTTEEDIERWANTGQGPRKLVAVLTHDKYPIDLRVEAAMTLVRMKPRQGRRVGIENLTAALAELPPAERAQIVTRMVPRLEAEIRKPPAPPAAPNQAPVDTSFPYKDAAYALLTQEDGTLVETPENKRRLRSALADWALVNFSERMDDSSQTYGMEQLLRYLGAEGVQRLPGLIDPNAKKIDRMSELIAELGSVETKQAASAKLVEVAKQVASPAWIEQKKPAVEAANKASKLNPTPAQLKQQLEQYQEEELLRVFSSMKRVGGAPVVEYLLAFAQDKGNNDKKRASAIAALEGNLDKNNPKHARIMLDIASDKGTPDMVRDVALRRVGEMPRKQVIDDLYALFKSDNWKIRWVAAELILRMSDTSQLPEFMAKLGDAKGMAITEPLRYGALIGEMKGSPPPEQAVRPFADKEHPVQARLSALSYFYERGNQADLAFVQRFADDKSRVPECQKDAVDCDWKCAVTTDKGQEDKQIATVGEFVSFCIKPALEKRTKPTPAPK